MTPVEPGTRPRVEGDRESEILASALEVLLEVGIDRLTMDAVAQRASASKATLYRRWADKTTLVAAALAAHKRSRPVPDTGTLRTDLQAMFCGKEGVTDPRQAAMMAGIAAAIARDPEFADAFRSAVVAPQIHASRTVWERARDRGEVRPDLDLDLVESALSGIVLHRVFVLGETPDDETVTRIIDQILLPCSRPQGAPLDTAATQA
ncbi:TetR/AcrR family transcriptional regulator [Nocardioides bruguierae]|uniref:TetR/AcrR family transcriptional regulator n=1 Tax=Nocardioides bruguierae TaxID=2945102 RepID=A0A9X2D665_9ACTN|nr:TetR/AcrR family transcriptional regulator [Nocardioides bruguierae]MCL8026507.1 TetR/AcrR family transcriptional regulator [Nocardioides bruguierae]MCM0619759.1 TetR/AcrR family transcriptional regulator [Nocardioides bruguierae]